MGRPEAPFQNQPFLLVYPQPLSLTKYITYACFKGKKLEVRGHLPHPIASSYFVQLQWEDSVKRDQPLSSPHTSHHSRFSLREGVELSLISCSPNPQPKYLLAGWEQENQEHESRGIWKAHGAKCGRVLRSADNWLGGTQLPKPSPGSD